MKNLKNWNQKNIHSIHQGVIRPLDPTTPIDAPANAFPDASKPNFEMENFMKKILLALTVLTAFNFALADENTAVYFQRDQRLGQFNMSFKMVINGSITQFEQKICFVSDRLQDEPYYGKLEPGCTAKKLKDSPTDLEYLVTCVGKPDTNMHWIRISQNEFTFVSKSNESEITSTYRYVGTTCDADAIRK